MEREKEIINTAKNPPEQPELGRQASPCIGLGMTWQERETNKHRAISPRISPYGAQKRVMFMAIIITIFAYKGVKRTEWGKTSVDHGRSPTSLTKGMVQDTPVPKYNLKPKPKLNQAFLSVMMYTTQRWCLSPKGRHDCAMWLCKHIYALSNTNTHIFALRQACVCWDSRQQMGWDEVLFVV